MIFVDTSAWIALCDKSDRFHNEAVFIYNNLKSEKEKFISTDYVLDESITRLRYDTTHKTALSFLELVEKAENLGVLKLIKIDGMLYQEKLGKEEPYEIQCDS